MSFAPISTKFYDKYDSHGGNIGYYFFFGNLPKIKKFMAL